MFGSRFDSPPVHLVIAIAPFVYGGYVRGPLLRLAVTGIALVMLLPAAASAQTRVITGAITVAGTAEPLPGASVIIVGTAAATRAGADGHYRLVAPEGNV